jgi:hypothetical protein
MNAESSDRSQATPPAPTTLWARPATISEHEVVRGFGGVVPSVLAGFSLSTIATLVTSDNPPPLDSWAVAGLIVTASSMLYAMQFLFTALRYWSSPADILMWHPEATQDPAVLRMQRWYQALDQALFKRYAARGRFWYNVGITAFSVSIVLLLVPFEPAPQFRLADAAVLAVASAGLAGEILLVSGGYVPAIRSWLWPDPRDMAKRVPKPPVIPIPEFLQGMNRQEAP